MKFKVLTLFPEIYAALDGGILGKALQNGLFAVEVINIRDYSENKHKKCDDYPFGGGAGMVMTPQPIHDAIKACDEGHTAKRIYLSPKGEKLTQSVVRKLAEENEILLLNGSYEGVDQRVIDMDIDYELSVGDYVLTSGDFASLVVINAVARYIPGVLGSEQSTEEESFSDGLLEYPQYTRPQIFEGAEVPEVLLSGNHENVRKWRLEQARKITRERRPDLLEKQK
ncbi:MAG TPA: tRNA (guanosine(37)-N1)-methyltransferase TrmD [Candidatus Faecicola pullistercoris]|nr:tRNA (guanosine(37)-N1)-methyltransferase TrmD [Candidatus Faecicola pullistercoris]